MSYSGSLQYFTVFWSHVRFMLAHASHSPWTKSDGRVFWNAGCGSCRRLLVWL